MESDFPMAKGEGENSYMKNSRLQQKALFETKPVLEKALTQVYSAVLPRNLVVGDLGCGSSENTLIFVSKVINAMSGHPVGLQFFLNDLPTSDFNNIFRSLQHFKKSVLADNNEETLPQFYVAALPGSYYTRLFPCQTVHFFHSSYCLHWRSRLPDGLYSNGRNIYIAKTTPLPVVKMYQEQFEKDFLLFLELRHKELVFGGQMVLTFLGRKDEDVYNGSLNYLLEPLAQSLSSLVEKSCNEVQFWASHKQGLVEEEKLNSFNGPFYGASVGEVKEVVKQSGLFDMNHIKLFEANWDPYDDSEDGNVQDSIQSGLNIAKCIRATTETLFVSHFGEFILDALFKEYASKMAEYLERDEKKTHSVIILSLQRR
ncbi:hypothetical protein ACP70R_041514 [Stipagrostis hirtigluma subsp. patula]